MFNAIGVLSLADTAALPGYGIWARVHRVAVRGGEQGGQVHDGRAPTTQHA